MSKLNKVVGAALFTAGAMVAGYLLRRLQKENLMLNLENCAAEVLTIYLGTKAAPDAVVLEHFAPKEKKSIDLTLLPLLEHDVIYIRFQGEGESYRRTLIYDIDEYHGPMQGMIVDYGQKNYDVKLVKLS